MEVHAGLSHLTLIIVILTGVILSVIYGGPNFVQQAYRIEWLIEHRAIRPSFVGTIQRR